MADISLREYLTKLDTLLKSGSAAEVILHCRHILQYYPKDAQAYRLLGQSLVATSRWPEAGEVMRRVLSIFPDDREAHAGLSEVYRIEKRPDDAIWHLERAFEQAPNDQTILDNLRELYRRYRKTEHGKVQLTAAAVARQYIRNGLYEQAIDTLQKARAASPERLDLPLLLAQTYWDRGQHVEAAQTALEVLKVLPDCLVANTLLAALWLTESRPSDAQRYIGRIESLDPYLALELAQGEDVPDNAFKLPELDYQLAAEREMLAQKPDWLTDVTGTGEVPKLELPDEDAVPDFFNDITVDEDVVAQKNFSRDLTSADWASSDLSYTPDDTAPTVRKPTGSLTGGLASRLGKPPTGNLASEPPAQTTVPGPKRTLTGRLTPLPDQTPQPEPADSNDFDSFMNDILSPSVDEESALSPSTSGINTGDLPEFADLLTDSEPAVTDDLPFRRERAIASDDDNDPLAWLRSSGVEIDEEAPARANDLDQYDAEADNLALQEVDDADPLSWLQDYGGDDLVVNPPATPSAIRNTDELPIPEDQAGDPLAWLHNDDEPTITYQPPPTTNTPEPVSAAASADEDPLDWLTDDSLLDEQFDLESLVNNEPSLPEQRTVQAEVSSTAETPDWQDTMADEKDPLDWLSSEPDAEPSDDFTWMDEGNQSDIAAPSKNDFPDWLSSSTSSEVVGGAETASENDIDWMTDLPDLGATELNPTPAAEVPKPAGTGMLDWLGKQGGDTSSTPANDQSNADVPDWLGDLQTETPATTDASSKIDENGFEWMSTADELPPVPSSNDVPDWLSSMDIGNEAADEPEPLAAADTPDWLTEMKPQDAEPEPLGAADTPDWLSSMGEAASEPVASDTPDWLSSMSTDEEPEAEPLAAADTPEWLTDMKPQDDEPEPLAAADTPDWLSSMNIDEEPQASAEPTSSAPSWLNRSEPEATNKALAQASETQDWLSSMESESNESQAASNTPDWLSALPSNEPQAEPEPSADVPDWLSSMNADEEPEAEPLAAADTPDWLSSMNADEEPEAEPLAAADTPDWLNALQPDEAQPEAEPLAAADEPDWLAAMQTPGEPAAEPLAAADEPDWLAAMQPDEPLAEADEPEAEPLAAADTPDWLSAMQPDEAKAEPLATSDTPDWLSSLEPTDEPEAEPLATSDQPDWLSAMQPDEPETEPEPLTAADQPDWLSAMQPVDESQPEAEPLSSADQPDWLSAMQPNDEAEAEPEPLATADEPDWLSAMQPADEQENDLEPLAAADEPDWLSAMQPVDDESQPEAEPLAAADQPDWLSAMQPADEPEAAAEPVTAADQPDWLSALQPEEEKAAPEPEPVAKAETPDWLAAMQPADEPENEPAIIDDTPDWLSAMQQPNETQPAADANARVPATNMSNWLDNMEQEPVTDADQSLSDEEWNEAAELEPQMATDTPDWLSAMNNDNEQTTTSNGETGDTYQWEAAPAGESRPAAPAPASNAPDWLNAMVPGLDVDYDAPEDEPVETEFLPTNRAPATPSKPAQEGQTRPEFGWLLDIVDEESQQVTVVADKKALRRFVFSKLPTWLRKPTEQPDKSPAGDSEADVDIPPWLQ